MGIVGIMGAGIVGGTLRDSLDAAGVATRTYDPYLGIGRIDDLAPTNVVFVCVPTPAEDDGGFDLTEVWAAVDAVVPVLGPGAVVAMKSTVPPGTCDRLAAAFPGQRFCSAPEFLVAARPEESLVRQDRVIIGASSDAVASLVAGFLSLVSPMAPIVRMLPIEAELTKLCSNVMLASKVALANELALVCEEFGASWPTVQAGVGLDRRIGPDHLAVTAERGFGGACFPKDLDGMIAAAREVGYTPTVLMEIVAFNRRIRGEAAATPLEGANGVEVTSSVTAWGRGSAASDVAS